MVTRDPDASFDTPNVVIGRQGRNELTLSFRPHPYLHRLLIISKPLVARYSAVTVTAWAYICGAVIR